MSKWCKGLLKVGGRGEVFAKALLKEDAGKKARLASTLAASGVTLNKEFVFIVPQEKDKLVKISHQMERAGWKLTFRIINPNDRRLVFRALDKDAQAISDAIARLDLSRQWIVSVSPNKDPLFSGTVLMSEGDVYMEMVYGPHNWLTKVSPEGVTIFSCWYCLPHVSVQYSTTDQERRLTLYRCLNDVARIMLGMSLRQISETKKSLYAEFQWHKDLGYRFFDCSFSWAWSGKR
ncbi:MAG: hypothetical protein M0022_04960 [Desulfobacteraceae bacterium]|nr:hypothetical protein [Desulfobacteraceae bacterium]